jgi:hypothetical protein
MMDMIMSVLTRVRVQRNRCDNGCGTNSIGAGNNGRRQKTNCQQRDIAQDGYKRDAPSKRMILLGKYGS